MKLGNAPCSWGVEFADDPRNPPWQSVLDECAAAGFEGVDLGPVGFFPEDPALFRDALQSRNLTLSSAVVFRPFHDPAAGQECRDATIRTCRSLVAQGASQLVLIDSIAPERTKTLGQPGKAPTLSPENWKSFASRIRDAAKIATEEYGLTASIHSHAGGYCDFRDETERLLAEIDPRLLKVCIDTAHMTLAGMDPMDMTRRYADRITHVHLKDIDPVKRHDVVSNGIEFYKACADTMFCQMGEGEIDFNAFRKLLLSIGYDGWCTVEQDCAPDAVVSRVKVARANREYLSTVGF